MADIEGVLLSDQSGTPCMSVYGGTDSVASRRSGDREDRHGASAVVEGAGGGFC